jgi:hypothetical protein
LVRKAVGEDVIDGNGELVSNGDGSALEAARHNDDE